MTYTELLEKDASSTEIQSFLTGVKMCPPHCKSPETCRNPQKNPLF